MSEHTPTPWYAMTAESGGLLDQATLFAEHETDGEPTYIADTMGIDDEISLEERKANAAFIVKAVNSHDAMVKALQAGEAAYQALIGRGGYEVYQALEDEATKLRQEALAQVLK